MPQILLNLRGSTAAFISVRVISARAGIHACHQDQPRRKFRVSSDPVDADNAFFERLPQTLQNGTGDFGQFVEKQRAVMGKRYFADLDGIASADQGL